jgi:hypothetical protein
MSQSGKNKIDQLFEESLRDYTAAVEPEVWSKIDQQLNNKTNPLGFCTYTWSIPSMSFTSNEINPNIIFSKIGRYEITLEQLKETNPKAAKEFEEFMNSKTE